ncbi:uncharacterized protein K460DRAFT_357927 [Cucurbitaria berberidis CBS 394.84]|uniref:Uncharacterized protein n=1 Tax=Cucurbitaria berberidis CBS 394.84 TaxID=1168544 RepID=A0A9P4GFB0_9PLEO|nr:uncharacterized protein K460DRAFT_357927 [Cucurbitaria berberidis CBS 394.84]KAF1844317.1 hypothetical protein K460DRAFT_357927 [Cucurbitaria berberidis CBS 394.84]
MGKRHNRKRTRSRPRHRDSVNMQSKNHTRSVSVDTTSSTSTIHSSIQPSPYPTAHLPADHWHQTYFAWQNRLREEQERNQEVEVQRLRIFGGEPGDEVSLLEPMMKVVTDLFDGFTDYEDP